MKFTRMIPTAVLALLLAPALLVAYDEDKAKPKKDPEATIKESLDKLSKADRQAAEAQRYCATESTSRLGSMGVPIKVDVSGQTVFVCCEGCKESALADPKATLVQVAKLKRIATAIGKLNAEDRTAAEVQAYCAVQAKNRLGSMGAPVKLVIKGSPVFLCCAGCKNAALANPDATLQKVAALKAPKEETSK